MNFEDLWNSKEVECIQNKDEFEVFYETVRALKPKTIIEIGVEQGGTLRFWIEALEDGGKVVGVDASQHVFQHVARHYDIHSFTNKNVILVKGNSQHQSTIDDVSKYVGQGEADFLFIDGSHEYPEVGQDLTLYSPFVKRGGLIAFHDIHPGCPGVVRTWEEMKDQLDNPHVLSKRALGVGVGYKK